MKLGGALILGVAVVLISSQALAALNLGYHSFTSYIDVTISQAAKPKAPVTKENGLWFDPVFVIKSSMDPFLVSSRPIGTAGEIKPLEVAAAIIGPVLNFPNPFRMVEGTQIGYQLSKAMDLEIHLYDIFGHLLLKKEIHSGDPGAKGPPDDYNLVTIDQTTLNGKYLPSSVYFYFIVNEGKVLGKGKMAVIP